MIPGGLELVHGSLVVIDTRNGDVPILPQGNKDRSGTCRPGRAEIVRLSQGRQRND